MKLGATTFLKVHNGGSNSSSAIFYLICMVFPSVPIVGVKDKTCAHVRFYFGGGELHI